MPTPKTPSKPRTKKIAAEAPVETPAEAIEAIEAAPAKKPARKKAAPKAEAPVVDAAPAEVAAPALTGDALRAEIRRRAYALYQAGSRDTFGNWMQAERETLGR